MGKEGILVLSDVARHDWVSFLLARHYPFSRFVSEIH